MTKFDGFGFAEPILRALTAVGYTAPQGSDRRVSGLLPSPTRELASQIADSFRTYGQGLGLRVAAVFGGPQIKRQP